MAVSFSLSKVTLRDGTIVEPPLDGMTVFTGPNNSGKSLLLRELVTGMHTYPRIVDPSWWVDSVEVHQEGTGEEFIAWLQERGYKARLHQREGRSYLPGSMHSGERGPEVGVVVNGWNTAAFQQLSHLLVNDQWTDQRLANQADSNTWDQAIPPNHPSQLLWEDQGAHAQFSQLFEIAFGEPIAINRYVPQIRLQVGSTGMTDTPPPASAELRAAYEALPYLAEQGDGVRAFANILLHALVRPAPVIIIDEPEAFLHPPQARLLGRYLATHTPSPCQVIVATHSADFLSGVLEGNDALEAGVARPLALVRISRTDGGLAARVLAPGAVKEILDTPLLRYSNIVSGIFHDGVVLCEAEGDCHFYAATHDVVRSAGRHDNLTFLHVNGKARLADAARKLRSCGIPVAVITDFDFLNDVATIKQALIQLGGQWEDVKDDVQVLHGYTVSSVIASPASEIKKGIGGIIGNPSGNSLLSRRQVDDIAKLLKTANVWKMLKISGMGGLGGGAPYNSAQRLLEYFADLGVFIAPVGELERWVREVSAAKKSVWLTRVFDEGYYKNPNAELRQFMALVAGFLANAT